jgi:hypothetical protein
MKILYLTLKQLPFQTMVTGEKDREYRTPEKWIKSRLFYPDGTPKKYDLVKFTNGYESYKNPYFAATFLGFEIAQKNYKVTYSTGLVVYVHKGDFRIKLGSIVRKGNINKNELKLF